MAKKVAAKATEQVVIPEVREETVEVPIRGIDGPLVVHNWSQKALSDMLAKQMHRPLLEVKAPKDPEADFRASLYQASDDTYGFPATGFKKGMVRASKDLQDLDMVTTRGLVFVVGDCEEDRKFIVTFKDGTTFEHKVTTSLVRLLSSKPKQLEPQMHMALVRLNGSTSDVRFRGAFYDWEAILKIRFNPDRISAVQVANLVNIAGHTVGVGEGRPEKTDMGWGRYEVDTRPKGKRKKAA
jgi:hypothetical protein